MFVKFPCNTWQKAVAKGDHVIPCDNCNLWVYIKYNKINFQTYQHLQNNNTVV